MLKGVHLTFVLECEGVFLLIIIVTQCKRINSLSTKTKHLINAT